MIDTLSNLQSIVLYPAAIDKYLVYNSGKQHKSGVG